MKKLDFNIIDSCESKRRIIYRSTSMENEMENVLEAKQPKLIQEGFPDWHHHHSRKMKLVCESIASSFVVIQGSAAELVISRLPSGNFMLKWLILHSGSEHVRGQVIFSSSDLASAFRLHSLCLTEESGQLLVNRFGGEVAKQMCYIRWKQYLNIPGPGTGHDGDPNLSVRIDDQMTEAVRKLIHQNI